MSQLEDFCHVWVAQGVRPQVELVYLGERWFVTVRSRYGQFAANEELLDDALGEAIGLHNRAAFATALEEAG